MLIPTTKGPGEPIVMMDEALLVKKTGVFDNNIEYTTWTEYWLDGKLVHRSVHVTLKKMPAMFGEAEKIGG